MSHILVAAAIPEGSLVKIPALLGKVEEMRIDHVENSTPRPGKITWRDTNGLEVIIGGNVRIEVLELP